MRHSLTIGEDEHFLWLSRRGETYLLHLEDEAVPVALEALGGCRYRLTVDGESCEILLAVDGDVAHIHLDGAAWSVRYADPVLRHAGHAGGGADEVATAPMPGVAVAVHVGEGDLIARGTTLLVIESMKLQTAIQAWRDGTVMTVHVAVGQAFDRGAPLISLAPETEA